MNRFFKHRSVPKHSSPPAPDKSSARTQNLWHLLARRPYAALTLALLIILTSVLNVAEVIAMERFINGFSLFHWERSFLFALLLCGIYTFHYIQTPLSAYLNSKIGLQLRRPLEHAIAKKTARISAAALEDSINQALLTRLQDHPEKHYINGFHAILQILGGTLGCAGIFLLIWDNAAFFFPVILLLLGLMVIAFRLIGRNKVALYRARKEISRRGGYLSDLLFERRLAQEKKLFGYTPYIQKLYKEEEIHSNRKLFGRIFISNLILWFYDNITYLFSALAYLLFLIPLYKGELQIGLYIAIIPALTKLGSFFVSVGSNYLPAYQEYRASLADIRQLNRLPEQYYVYAKDGGTTAFHEIRGENIVFSYPGQQTPVLNGLDFTLQPGKNYALVGENGCGKTTLIRLLMGFYQPHSGSITIDGENIQDMEFGRLQHFFSAVFQDFNRYDYSIRENICLSALDSGKPESQIQQAAQEADLDAWIADCPDGYNTRLGSLEEESVNLSGGQWQRLAIARMLYRNARICIWDEPTASMDPLAESRLYSAFLQKRSPDCTNIFITHRLGAAVHADEIFVMEHGRLAEQGNHETLMQKTDGLYRRMFEAQKGMYE